MNKNSTDLNNFRKDNLIFYDKSAVICAANNFSDEMNDVNENQMTHEV